MIRRFLYTVIIVIGIGIFFYPDISTWLFNKQAQTTIHNFQDQQEDLSENTDLEKGPKTETESAENMEEKLRIVKYNKSLFENGEELTNTVMKEIPDVVDNPDGLFGYIDIPAMNNLSLPLYIGASDEHMGKGAALLGGTSIPVGGQNTNAVIAGHRGWRSVPYFKYIELLKIGDIVKITNPWETLTYKVEKIKIIQPDDDQSIGIQEGKDMVTLITCHPYRSNGKYRYAVYCVRDDMYQEDSSDIEKDTPVIFTENTEYLSSEDDIRLENRLRKIASVLIIGMVIFTICIQKRRKENEK